jgi:hypothetical protein
LGYDYSNFTDKQQQRLTNLENKYAYQQEVANIKAKYTPQTPSLFMNPAMMMGNAAMQSNPMTQMSQFMPMMMQFMVMKMLFQQLGGMNGSDNGSSSQGNTSIDQKGISWGKGETEDKTGVTTYKSGNNTKTVAEDDKKKTTSIKYADYSSESETINKETGEKSVTIDKKGAAGIKTGTDKKSAVTKAKSVTFTYEKGAWDQDPSKITIDGKGFTATDKTAKPSEDDPDLSIYKSSDGYYFYTPGDHILTKLSAAQVKEYGLHTGGSTHKPKHK